MKIELLFGDDLFDAVFVNNDSWALAQREGINFLSDKEFVAGHVDTDEGIIVSALVEGYGNGEYSFDVAVDHRYQKQGLGKELIEIAMGNFEMYKDVEPDAVLNLDVVNPNIVKFLEREYGLSKQETEPERYKMSALEYRYGVPLRPIGFATVPKGYIGVEQHPKFRHGVVVYDRPLTEDEIASFELVPFLSDEQLQTKIDDIVNEMAEYKQEYLEELEDDPRFFRQMVMDKFEQTGLGFHEILEHELVDQIAQKLKKAQLEPANLDDLISFVLWIEDRPYNNEVIIGLGLLDDLLLGMYDVVYDALLEASKASPSYKLPAYAQSDRAKLQQMDEFEDFWDDFDEDFKQQASELLQRAGQEKILGALEKSSYDVRTLYQDYLKQSDVEPAVPEDKLFEEEASQKLKKYADKYFHTIGPRPEGGWKWYHQYLDQFGLSVNKNLIDFFNQGPKQSIILDLSPQEAEEAEDRGMELQKAAELLRQAQNLSQVLILDIDGTLADASHRQHLAQEGDYDGFFEERLVEKDEPIPQAQKCLGDLLSLFDRVVYMTGRPEKLKQVTTNWLNNHYQIEEPELLMRPNGDTRASSIIKHELFLNNLVEEDAEFTVVDDENGNLWALSPYAAILEAPVLWDMINKERG